MNTLIERARRFSAETYGEHRGLFEQLAAGQKPDVLWICCSDSRIDPHLITHSKPGTLFVVRNPGNIVPAPDTQSGEAAAIEFAIDALGVREVVVCGHSGCGAVKAARDPEAAAHLPAMQRWAAQIPAAPSPEIELHEHVEHNVLHQLERLRAFPCVRKGVASGKLRVSGWVYHIGSGRIDVYDGARFTDVREHEEAGA